MSWNVLSPEAVDNVAPPANEIGVYVPVNEDLFMIGCENPIAEKSSDEKRKACRSIRVNI
jgi:hypothetical protein